MNLAAFASSLLLVSETFVIACGNENIAEGKPARQVSVFYGNTADRAVDGNTNVHYYGSSCMHTKDDDNPWWEVNLTRPEAISRVVIYNRFDFRPERLTNIEVQVKATAAASYVSCSNHVGPIYDPCISLACRASGQYVRIVKFSSHSSLSMCEVQVYRRSPTRDGFFKKTSTLGRDRDWEILTTAAVRSRYECATLCLSNGCCSSFYVGENLLCTTASKTFYRHGTNQLPDYFYDL